MLLMVSTSELQKKDGRKSPKLCVKKAETDWESLLKNICLKANSSGYPLGICALWWELVELSIIHNRLVLVCGKI